MSDDVDVEQIISQWERFNLTQRRTELDKAASLIADARQSSVASRKALTEKTKSIRNMPEPERSQNTSVLVKAYQTEIDKLTQRGNVAEESFLSLYQALATIPDPLPGLEVCSRHNACLCALTCCCCSARNWQIEIHATCSRS
jgi:hypothetical protein